MLARLAGRLRPDHEDGNTEPRVLPWMLNTYSFSQNVMGTCGGEFISARERRFLWALLLGAPSSAKLGRSTHVARPAEEVAPAPGPEPPPALSFRGSNPPEPASRSHNLELDRRPPSKSCQTPRGGAWPAPVFEATRGREGRCREAGLGASSPSQRTALLPSKVTNPCRILLPLPSQQLVSQAFTLVLRGAGGGWGREVSWRRAGPLRAARRPGCAARLPRHVRALSVVDSQSRPSNRPSPFVAEVL